MGIEQEIAALKRMTVGELRRRYEALFGEPCRSFNRQHLFRRCAWRVQALAEGELSERAKRRAQELARDVDLRVRPPRELDMPRATRTPQATVTAGRPFRRGSDARLPMPGTRLTRKYKGHVYEVEVLSNGFAYEGEVYRSLSAVAHAITGGHWNGYLFFGLTDPRQEDQ